MTPELNDLEKCNCCEKVTELKTRNDRLNNYGILIEDIKAYCKLQPKTNYTAQRILEAIEQGYWG